MSIRNPPAPLPNAFEELDRVEPPRHKKPEAQNADFRRGGEDVGNNGSDPNALWSVPKDIETSLLPVPQMREEMLPELLSRWLLDVAKRMQCPIDLLASAAVVMFGSLAPLAAFARKLMTVGKSHPTSTAVWCLLLAQ
jgi:hypothetical protein